MEDDNENPSAVHQLAYDLSVARLDSQLRSALAADSRAMSFAGLMVTAATVLTGLAGKTALPGFMFTGAILLLFSAGLAGWAARPTKFYMPGSKFCYQDDDIKTNRPLHEVLQELGSHNDQHGDANSRVLQRNARFLEFAFMLALVGVLVAVAPQLYDRPPWDAQNVSSCLYLRKEPPIQKIFAGPFGKCDTERGGGPQGVDSPSPRGGA